ncbi:DUF6077 domain-containing protein [Micromonospora sp. C51]|uniref:DUF6077 domain-containing protein n=1 Tax=Micromonospora sp. C51 TaxID=2824879 RepID=UPI001FFDBBDA|nr:DUF6077 domain-containing protein [Micromonospora sp. C51]
MTDQAAAPSAAIDEPTAPAPGRSWLAVSRVGAVIAGLPTALTDGAVLVFALWTLLYHAALPLGLAPSWTFRVWLAASLALVLLIALTRWRHRRGAPDTAGGTPDSAGVAPGSAGVAPGSAGVAPGSAGGAPDAAGAGPASDADPAVGRTGRAAVVRRSLTALVLVSGTVAAVTAGLAGTPAGADLSWWVPASAGIVAATGLVLLTRRTWRTWRDAPATRPPAPTAWQSAYALLVAGGAAAASLILARNTPDDIYYVGRSVWVAERDNVPLNDFLFSENVLPAMASQPPIASIEVLAGALARFLGISAASAIWYLLLPLLAVLAVLALWRLVQHWAPRRPVLAFTVAIAFLALVCGPDAALGNIHLPRLYQGKGMFVSAVVPLMWLYLTRWFDDRSRLGLLLIAALSITATGLTTTAAIVLPLLVGGAALMMLLVGRWKSALAVGAVALTYPIGAVVISQLILGSANEAAADVNFYDAAHTYRRTFEVGIVGVIGGLALWCGPLLARRRSPALLAAGGTVTLSVLLVPGVLEWLSALTGISVVLWRVSWLFALPALIGLLCTVWLPTRLPAVRALAGVVLAGAMVGSFAVYAVPMWDERSGVLVHDEPTWKIRPKQLAIARFIVGLDRPDGLVLAPESIMRTIPLLTTEARVVLPRDFFLIEYDINSQFSQNRLLLTRFANGGPAAQRPSAEEVGAALERLDVGTICVYSQNRYARQTGEGFGYTTFARRKADPPVHPNAVTCLRRG